ncbi:MAG TPA: hypothetical protein VEJ45_00875 [Candidatus Acidoferrales bacterium]|nr:hypothetical protein [Candidatus Acidoferrales bacterium]
MSWKSGLWLSLFGAGLLLLVPAHGFAAPQQGPSEPQAEQTKSVSGKVASIASDKKSIVLEVNNGDDKQTMQFIVNQNTQVTGRVSAGSMAIVQYQPTDDNQYLALVITPQNTP